MRSRRLFLPEFSQRLSSRFDSKRDGIVESRQWNDRNPRVRSFFQFPGTNGSEWAFKLETESFRGERFGSSSHDRFAGLDGFITYLRDTTRHWTNFIFEVRTFKTNELSLFFFFSFTKEKSILHEKVYRLCHLNFSSVSRKSWILKFARNWYRNHSFKFKT